MDHPICLMHYFDGGEEDKSIEIRFDESYMVITCLFDSNEKCNLILLFPGREEIIKHLIYYLKRNYNYDFIKKQVDHFGFLYKDQAKRRGFARLLFRNIWYRKECLIKQPE